MEFFYLFIILQILFHLKEPTESQLFDKMRVRFRFRCRQFYTFSFYNFFCLFSFNNEVSKSFQKDSKTNLWVLFSEAWLCPSPDLLPHTMSPGTPDTPDTVMCTIQVRKLQSSSYNHFIILYRYTVYTILEIVIGL